MFDVAVVGAGIAGMATAARLRAAGLSTVVFEQHGQPGGCAGYYRRRGFAFDVGATTLVDFSPGGIGGDLLADIGLQNLAADELPGYVAWLPDRKVTLHRNVDLWRRERLAKLGDTPAHRRLWEVLDRLAAVFWQATRLGARLPMQSLADVQRNLRCMAPHDLPLLRYLRWTVGDLLRSLGLIDDLPLVRLLAMLLEDTVHATIDHAPLINGSLGITIRGAGLTRAHGGMYGFWQRWTERYRELGGCLRVGCPVHAIRNSRQAGYELTTRRGLFHAAHVVGAVPIDLTAKLAGGKIAERLQPYLRRNGEALGGALVLFLGVPEFEVADQPCTHHQLLQDYHAPLGNGNNMFISVSAPGDMLSAPAGHRSVMVSTHCELNQWRGLSPTAYEAKKAAATAMLLGYARRVYPNLGERAVVCELGTPRTFERFTRRTDGAVGGFRQTLQNTNQWAVPHDIGVPNFWLVGDTTWPGLGTVACVQGSRVVAERILAAIPAATRRAPPALRPAPSCEDRHDSLAAR